MEIIYLSSEKYNAVVDAYRSQHGYDDMSDEQKRAFDERLDEVIGQETDEDEDPDQPEKVLKRTSITRFKKIYIINLKWYNTYRPIQEVKECQRVLRLFFFPMMISHI